MDQLFLACKRCGREFPSGLGIPVEMLAMITLEGNRHQCPYCGSAESYDQADYHARPPRT